MGYEIFNSMVFWASNFFLKKFVKPSGTLSYILDVSSLKVDTYLNKIAT